MREAQTLRGTEVIDLTAARPLGNVDDLVLNPDTRTVVAFAVTSGASLLSAGKSMLIPPSAIHAIGPDAITVRDAAASGEASVPGGAPLPRLSEITGRKVVTHGGVLLGSVKDVLVDVAPGSGHIRGYLLNESPGALQALIDPPEHTRYLRADGDVRIGPDVILTADDAVTPYHPSAAER